MFKEHSCCSLSFFCDIFLPTLFKQLADLVIHTTTITEKHSMVYAMTADGLLRTTSLKCRKMHGLVIFYCSDLIVMFLLEVLVLGLHFGLQYWLNLPSFSVCDLLIHLNLIKTTRSDKNLDYFLFRMKRLQELLPHPKKKKIILYLLRRQYKQKRLHTFCSTFLLCTSRRQNNFNGQVF